VDEQPNPGSGTGSPKPRSNASSQALRDVPLGLYDVTVSFVTYEPDREIAWTIVFNGNPIGHVYGYRLEPIDQGTIVTQYYDWSNVPDELKSMVTFPVVSESTLRATLGVLSRTVAPGTPRPETETI
jgi:hypothetical protein